MSIRPTVPQPVTPSVSARSRLRVEYLGFADSDVHRLFRFRVYGIDGYREFAMRVAHAAFDARRMRMQDCPDLCYQRLLQVIDAGGAADTDVITIEDADFVTYREDHTEVPRRRPRPAVENTAGSMAPPRPAHPRAATPRSYAPQPAPAPAVPDDAAPVLEEGQRVRHAVFGMGVTETATPTRTTVCFDDEGRKSFVSAMLEVEVLSAPRTWETSRGGTNRKRLVAAAATPTP